jgi:hypothetical protein
MLTPSRPSPGGSARKEEGENPGTIKQHWDAATARCDDALKRRRPRSQNR